VLVFEVIAVLVFEAIVGPIVCPDTVEPIVCPDTVEPVDSSDTAVPVFSPVIAVFISSVRAVPVVSVAGTAHIDVLLIKIDPEGGPTLVSL